MRAILCAILLCLAGHVAIGATPGATHAAAAEARAAIEEWIGHLATADATRAEAAVDPGMLNYHVVIDGIRLTATRQKQIRITLKDVQATAANGIVFVQADWEKRFLSVPSLTPMLRSGRSVWTLRRGDSGWTLIGIGGDDLFGP